MDQIWHKSCEDLADLPDESVTLTVTSPPYWNAIDYDRHARGDSGNYRTRRYAGGFNGYGEYLDWLAAIFAGVRGKTEEGGFLAVVIGTVLLEGSHYPVPMDLAARLTAGGWEFFQDIIWNKVTGGVKRAGVYIQHPYPGYYRANIMTEYILVFRKPGEPIFRRRSPAQKEAAAEPIDRLFTKDIANNIWHIAPVPPGRLEHPCPFPEEIPWRLIRLFSYPGDLVLDPFAGSGQTTKVARHLGRHYAGYDIEARYVEYARRRLEEPLAVRPQQLVAEYEKIPLEAGLTGPKRSHARTRHGAGFRGTRK